MSNDINTNLPIKSSNLPGTPALQATSDAGGAHLLAKLGIQSDKVDKDQFQLSSLSPSDNAFSANGRKNEKSEDVKSPEAAEKPKPKNKCEKLLSAITKPFDIVKHGAEKVFGEHKAKSTTPDHWDFTNDAKKNNNLIQPK